jgi:tRNA wybutosine-synthesizing protein 1
MSNPQEYADIIQKCNPDFIEIKAYMYVGSSRDRLVLDNMPSLEDVNSFAESVANLCGREIVNSAFESRVVLLS